MLYTVSKMFGEFLAFAFPFVVILSGFATLFSGK
jgi:hypothetical protein